MATAVINTRRTRHVLEFVASPSVAPRARGRVDREKGVIRGVKILGRVSSNGPEYTPAALRAARPLYEGARVFVDHPNRGRPDGERSLGDWVGVLRDVREESDGLYADFQYLKGHALSARICEAAERFPDKFGFSHNAHVAESMHGGRVVYEQILRVRSVDLVCRPATTRGVFESESPGGVAAGGSPWFQQFADGVRRVFSQASLTPAQKAKQIGKLANLLLTAQAEVEAVRQDAAEIVPGLPKNTDVDPVTGMPNADVRRLAREQNRSHGQRLESAVERTRRTVSNVDLDSFAAAVRFRPSGAR